MRNIKFTKTGDLCLGNPIYKDNMHPPNFYVWDVWERKMMPIASESEEPLF